jgi:uncharacterized membrane-anchored protein
MRISLAILLLCALPWNFAVAQFDEDEYIPPFEWIEGPTMGSLSSIAEIDVPEGYLFLEGDATRILLEIMENPTSGAELGTMASADTSTAWFAFFEFSNIGYVNDDDREELDADALLEAIRQGTAVANEERRSRGWAELNIIGWKQMPDYDPRSNNLQWAILGESEGHQVVNYNIRILGRHGVMEVSLVGDPQELDFALPEFKGLLEGFAFKPGNRYAEWVKGDKVAEVGLAALVLGGGAALAAKTGLLAKFWKFIVFGFIAIGGFFRRLFGGKSNQAA